MSTPSPVPDAGVARSDTRENPALTSTPPGGTLPRDLDRDAIDAVDGVLAQHVEQRGATLLRVSPELAPVVEVLAQTVSRGKRLRAAFCLWAARAAGGDEDSEPAACRAAAALEMFHLGALMHDDVMDRSDYRRGSPTVHRSFAELHHRRQLHGDGVGFGDAVAVLVGDLCLTSSDDLFAAALAHAPTHEARTRQAWEEMRSQVLAGQYLDLVAQARMSASVEEATRVLHYKSARYTVAHPLMIGSSLAGASGAVIDSLTTFGLRVGEAFQLRDDLLGVFGDPEVTGKSTYDDVREGKQTLLIAWAEQGADSTQRSTLRRHLGDQELDLDGLTAVREVLTETGARGQAEARIRHLLADGHALLDSTPLRSGPRQALGSLADACAWRAS